MIWIDLWVGRDVVQAEPWEGALEVRVLAKRDTKLYISDAGVHDVHVVFQPCTVRDGREHEVRSRLRSREKLVQEVLAKTS